MPSQATEVYERITTFLRDVPVAATPDAEFRAARFDAGLAFVHFPPGLGGIDADQAFNSEVERRFVEAGAVDWTDRNVIGLGLAAPTLVAWGTPDQFRLLKPLFVGTDIWCQLFSEPGAGSDLAGVTTRAERDGDEWVINGQKVWSTLAHVARWGLLLARFDQSVPRHQGLVFFVLDMRATGVEVRPLRQMTGEAEFNEVFLTDVRMPDAHMLGRPGDGWRVAMTTLMSERRSLGATAPLGSRSIDRALSLFRAGVDDGTVRASDRERLMQCYVEQEVASLTNQRLAVDVRSGPIGSIAKLWMARSNQHTYSLALHLLGANGMLIDNYLETRPERASVHGPDDVGKAFLRTRANSIEGGTSEVLRNVLAERVLGLPTEPRVTDRQTVPGTSGGEVR